MRLWSTEILPYLPKLQYRGQFRELLVIMRTWRDKGTTNHLLINKVMEYPKQNLFNYFLEYSKIYQERFNVNIFSKYYLEFAQFSKSDYRQDNNNFYNDWLGTKEHLRIEMANLYEKHLGVGKSRITDEQWNTLLNGYKKITGESYLL